MSARSKSGSALNSFELTLLILAVVAALYFAGEVLKPLALVGAPELRPGARGPPPGAAGLPRVAAVVLTVVVALGLLGGIGYVVGQQLTSLAKRLPDYQGNIEKKLSRGLQAGAARRRRPAEDDGQPGVGQA